MDYFEHNSYFEILTGSTWMIKGLRGNSPSNHFWLLNRELEVLISNQMSLVQCLYDHPFHKKLKLTIGNLNNLQYLPPGAGDLVRSGGLITGFLDYFEQNGFRKNFIRCNFGKDGGVELVAFRSLSTFKSALEISICNRLSPPPKFIRPPLHMNCFRVKKGNEIVKSYGTLL